jgi:hypothetical protein
MLLADKEVLSPDAESTGEAESGRSSRADKALSLMMGARTICRARGHIAHTDTKQLTVDGTSTPGAPALLPLRGIGLLLRQGQNRVEGQGF